MQNAETVALGLALEFVSDVAGGFAIADVKNVEAVWTAIDDDLAVYGFVLHVNAMGRQYLELTHGDGASRGEAEVELLNLEDSEGLPDFEGADRKAETAQLNERLAQQLCNQVS